MSAAGTLNPINQRETYEGFGAALGSARLGKGMSSPIGERAAILKAAQEEAKAAANAAGLKSLVVQAVDNVTGLPKTYYWQPGMKSIKERP